MSVLHGVHGACVYVVLVRVRMVSFFCADLNKGLREWRLSLSSLSPHLCGKNKIHFLSFSRTNYEGLSSFNTRGIRREGSVRRRRQGEGSLSILSYTTVLYCTVLYFTILFTVLYYCTSRFFLILQSTFFLSP